MTLEERMRDYEQVTSIHVVKNLPVVIRVDGKNFSKFTKGFKKPFDKTITQIMQEVTEYLADNIQNCVIAYTQSDEISLVLNDYQNVETAPMFGNKVQKLASVAASLATVKFNELITSLLLNSFYETNYLKGFSVFPGVSMDEHFNDDNYDNYLHNLERKQFKATFDGRVFNLPVDDVDNYLLWRQRDCFRNSVNAFGRFHLGRKSIEGQNIDTVISRLKEEKNLTTDDIPVESLYGTLYLKEKSDESNWRKINKKMYDEIDREEIYKYI